ncbi:MAG: hypothetical protein SOY30_10305 [Eubacteriales bacterium]|nr:hypothetical protein [Eubacteriales bacterium]
MLRLDHRDEAVKIANHILDTADAEYPDLAEQVAFVRRIVEENI